MALALDQSNIGFYLEDWLTHVLESNKLEQERLMDGGDFYIPYAGMRSEVMRLIFIVCQRFDIEHHAKHMAIHLFDRYWCKLFWDLFTANVPSSNDSSSSEVSESALVQVHEGMRCQLKLAITVCIQIASKVDLYNSGLGLSNVRDLLNSIDSEREHTKASICSYELRVLRVLDFRLPHDLPIHMVELFLLHLQLGSNQEIRETCFQLLDMTYLYHDQMFEQLFYMANGRTYDRSNPKSRAYLKLEANGAFHAATVVVCSCFFHVLKRDVADSMVSKLSALVEIHEIDIGIMANILHNLVIDDEDYAALRERPTRSNEDEPET